jgi:signal transduction histidine kinase
VLLRERGWVRDIQIELQKKDGTVLPVLVSATAVRDISGRFVQSRASVFDITQRKLAEEEARRYAQRLRAISRRLVEVQESERRRLAGELHDRVGQNLTALNINLNIMRGQLSPESALKVRARLDDSLKLVEATVETIRNVMAELRPAVLDDYGLAAALRWYAEQFAQRTGVHTTVLGRDPIPRLSPTVEGALFRIAQESLTNVAKYAQARQARLLLETQSQGFCLTIADDGCGFDPAACPPPANHHGWGLMIMRERAGAVGGRLQVESALGQGTRVVVEVRA